jgi:hypothetical protein
MRQGLLIGIAAGFVSALVSFSAEAGGPALRLVLLFVIPLPLLLAGLGWGWLAAAAGGLAGALASAVLLTPLEGFGYLLAFGMPSAFIAYLAYLSRPIAPENDGREWYPVGRLIAAISLYGGALPVLALPFSGWSFDFLKPEAAKVIKAVLSQPGDPRLKPLSEEQIEGLADMIVAVAPAAISYYWLLIMTPNLYLAARIAGSSGRLARDWPDLPALAYPAGFSLLLGLALLATLAPGVVGIAGASFTGALLAAHLIAGLSLMHFLARRGSRWLLWLVYASLLLPLVAPAAAAAITPLATFLIIGAGLLEPMLKLKQRLGAPPPPLA